MPETANYAEINGANIYYEVHGAGHPLVLVHSLLFDSTQWDDMLPALAAHFQVVRYDQRGCGRSQAADVNASNDADLLALIDHLQLDRVYLLGLSVGGEIALNFTLDHPERVDALIMAGGGPVGWDDYDPEATGETAFHAAAKAGDYSRALDLFAQIWVDGPVAPAAPAVRRRARAMMERYTWGHWQQPAAASAGEPAQAAEGAVEEQTADAPIATEPSYDERLAAIAVPVLFVAGDRDQPISLTSNEASVKLVPSAELAVIPGAAHIIPLEEPDAFARVVIEFLERRGEAQGG